MDDPGAPPRLRTRIAVFVLVGSPFFTTFGNKFGPCSGGGAGTGVGFRFATKCLAFSGEVLVLVLLGPCCSLVPDIVDLVVEPAALFCLVRLLLD
jgi:hypothetical protein